MQVPASDRVECHWRPWSWRVPPVTTPEALRELTKLPTLRGGDVGAHALRVGLEQEYRHRPVREIVDHPRSAALASSLHPPPQLANAACTRDHDAGGWLCREMGYEAHTFHVVENVCGCLDEVQRLLEIAPAHALVSYWKAFINYRMGKAHDLFMKEGDSNSAAFVLPFRSESEEMLKWAITQTNSWKPKYYLALLYRDRNRIEDSYKLLSEIGDLPTESFFYSARAAEQKDFNLREKDLLKANKLDKNEWRYIRKLAEFYLNQRDYAHAVAITEPFYKLHGSNYIIGMVYAKCLLAVKRYADAAKLLTSIHIIPFEGATDGRELYRQTMLMQAIQNIQSKKFVKALDFISKARQFPDNLGSGKPYEEDIDYRIEDFLTALSYEKSI